MILIMKRKDEQSIINFANVVTMSRQKDGTIAIETADGEWRTYRELTKIVREDHLKIGLVKKLFLETIDGKTEEKETGDEIAF